MLIQGVSPKTQRQDVFLESHIHHLHAQKGWIIPSQRIAHRPAAFDADAGVAQG